MGVIPTDSAYNISLHLKMIGKKEDVRAACKDRRRSNSVADSRRWKCTRLFQKEHSLALRSMHRGL